MDDNPGFKAAFCSLLLQKKTNHFLDTHDKTDLRKYNNLRPPIAQPNQNGAISDQQPHHHSSRSKEDTHSFSHMEQEISMLREQIDAL